MEELSEIWQWINGRFKSLDFCSIFVVGLVFEDLKYTQSLGRDRVELDVDSMTTMRVIKNGVLSGIVGQV